MENFIIVENMLYLKKRLRPMGFNLFSILRMTSCNVFCVTICPMSAKWYKTPKAITNKIFSRSNINLISSVLNIKSNLFDR